MIVGLGNPGPKYANNRHNIGFRAIELYAERHRINVLKVAHKSIVGDGRVKGAERSGSGNSGGGNFITNFFDRPEHKVLLVKPQTYMNNSGEAVRALASFYKIEPDDILVIHDDLDLDAAHMRMRPNGGSGGQNGIKSIIQHLGTPDFARLRIGIGRPPGQMTAATYVLQDFLKQEAELFGAMSGTLCDWIDHWIFHGVESAMNKFNGKK